MNSTARRPWEAPAGRGLAGSVGLWEGAPPLRKTEISPLSKEIVPMNAIRLARVTWLVIALAVTK